MMMCISSFAALPSIMDVMKKMEDIEFIGTDVVLEMTLTQQKKTEGVKTMKTSFYRRDKDDSFLMFFTDPANEKGNGYLRVGDNMWMYRKNTRVFQKLFRYQSIASTRLNASNFEKKKFTQLYAPVLDNNGNEVISEELLGATKIPVYRFEVKAVVKDLEFPKVIFWVRKDNALRLKAESYSQSGKLMLSSFFPKYMETDGKYIFSKVLIVDEFDKGNKTMLEMNDVKFQNIDKELFTKAYLENLSK